MVVVRADEQPPLRAGIASGTEPHQVVAEGRRDALAVSPKAWERLQPHLLKLTDEIAGGRVVSRSARLTTLQRGTREVLHVRPQARRQLAGDAQAAWINSGHGGGVPGDDKDDEKRCGGRRARDSRPLRHHPPLAIGTPGPIAPRVPGHQLHLRRGRSLQAPVPPLQSRLSADQRFVWHYTTNYSLA